MQVSPIVQDLTAGGSASRQRGCERLADLLRKGEYSAAAQGLSEDQLRRVASMITEISPLLSVAAMDVFEAWCATPTGAATLSWTPAVKNQLMDGLLCRLADGKVPIRSKARFTLNAVVMYVDKLFLFQKLSVGPLFLVDDHANCSLYMHRLFDPVGMSICAAV